MTTIAQPPSDTQPSASTKPRLGEELPVFCEKCGYILHGMPIVRCEHCSVLQFHCPECGHHQPINTLRPAFQRMLGRVRAAWLALVVLLKLSYFGWLSFAWFAGGYEWSYSYNYRYGGYGGSGASIALYQIRWDDLIGMMLLGLLFGAVGRMLLLRWRTSWLVGLAIGGLIAAMMMAGAQFRSWEREIPFSPLNASLLSLIVLTALAGTFGAAVVWWIWVGMVHLFLPKRAAGALLDWQRAMSTPRVSGLARE